MISCLHHVYYPIEYWNDCCCFPVVWEDTFWKWFLIYDCKRKGYSSCTISQQCRMDIIRSGDLSSFNPISLLITVSSLMMMFQSSSSCTSSSDCVSCPSLSFRNTLLTNFQRACAASSSVVGLVSWSLSDLIWCTRFLTVFNNHKFFMVSLKRSKNLFPVCWLFDCQISLFCFTVFTFLNATGWSMMNRYRQ